MRDRGNQYGRRRRYAKFLLQCCLGGPFRLDKEILHSSDLERTLPACALLVRFPSCVEWARFLEYLAGRPCGLRRILRSPYEIVVIASQEGA